MIESHARLLIAILLCFTLAQLTSCYDIHEIKIVDRRVTSKLSSWEMISSKHVNVTGNIISQYGRADSNDFEEDWYQVTVPTTVMAGLIQNNKYKNAFYGMNLNLIDETQFHVPWWYRTNFVLIDDNKHNTFDSHIVLRFKGLNYKANIWINGKQIATINEAVGTFRYFDYDITQYIKENNNNNNNDETKINTLALEIYRPIDDAFPPSNNSTDLAISFVDWSPPPRDSNLGIWRDVELYYLTSSIQLKYPLVNTQYKSNDLANLIVSVELNNYDNEMVVGELCGYINFIDKHATTNNDNDDTITFCKNISILANQQQFLVQFPFYLFPVLSIKNPMYWWPWQMGEQNLYHLEFTFKQRNNTDGSLTIVDSLQSKFGIRQVTSRLDKNNFRIYEINNQPILIRGAGWAPDMWLRADKEKMYNELYYTKLMNLNAIRLEGKMENDYFFDIANELGLLILPGWCCCDAWQHWSDWSDIQHTIAQDSLRTQLKRLRIHPSVLLFLYSSDELPPIDVEKEYLAIISETQFPNPVLASASNLTSSITGPTGVKMSGPYAWVPPNYWLLNTMQNTTNLLGGAFGFLTEGGPGASPLAFESFMQVIPRDKWWPINNYWDFHCGNQAGLFRNLRFFTPPLNARYGNSSSAQEYLMKAQVTAYESHRAMFEAYSRNKYTSSTGLIQWMLNNAFPEMMWHLYDYFLNTDASFFATKKANEPLHAMFSYNDNSVWIINSIYTAVTTPINVTISVYSIDATQLYTYSTLVNNVAADSSVMVHTIPIASIIQNPTKPETYFVRLSIYNTTSSSSSAITINDYWLSTQPDVLDWNDSTFYITYCSQYADFTALQQLKKVNLVAELSYTRNPLHPHQVTAQVFISNPTDQIAFFVRVRLVDKSVILADSDKFDDEIQYANLLPINWNDNCLPVLLPKETRKLTAVAINVSPSAKIGIQLEIYNNVVPST